ncbi:MAG: DNA polymerase IV [Clostridiaceae bacterium]|nr:DNA polymerase IV [Clostridiaceae bacterium]
MRRVVFLIDMNAFFITCEMSVNPELKGHPAAVAGDPKNRSGIILAANYDARAFGVKTTMLVHEALSICPGLILVPPTRGLYERKSNEFMQILSRYTPVIQKNSIDEAWLDLTGCENLFGEPVQIAQMIMKEIMEELDLWCSIGISENKFLSKMASEMKKPLGITELWTHDVKTKLWPLGVREMYGIGKQTEKRLNEVGIITIGDLASCNDKLLGDIFGKYGHELKLLANGIDPSPVDPAPKGETRSISRSTTLSRDITDMEEARTVLLSLAEEVGEDARRNDFRGRTVSIVIRFSDFKTITRQKTIVPSYLTKDIYRTGAELLMDNWDCRRPIRLLGIGIANIDEDMPEQISIFDVNSELPDEVKKEEKLEKAMDEIRSRFGSDKLKRAKLLDGSNKSK